MRLWMAPCAAMTILCSACGSPSAPATSQTDGSAAAVEDTSAAASSALSTSQRRLNTAPRLTANGSRAAHAAARTLGVDDLSHVTAEFFGAIIVHPQQVTHSRLLASLPLDTMLAGFSGGVDPRQVERLMFLMGPPSDPKSADPFMPAAVLQFADPVNAREVLAKMWVDVEPCSIAGKDCLRQKTESPDRPVAFQRDERTIVIGAEGTLHRMITSGGAATPLAQRLAATDVSGELSAVFLVEPIRELVRALAQQAAPQYPALHEDLSVMSLFVRLEGDAPVELNLEGHDAAATARLDGAAREFVEIFQGAYPLMIRPAVLNPLPKELADALRAPMDEGIQRISVSTQANQVQIALQRPPAMDALPDRLAAAMAHFQETSDRDLWLNNLQQLTVAMHDYYRQYQTFPAAAVSDASGRPLLSWRVSLLRHMGPQEEALYKQFRLDEAWDSPHNLRLVSQIPEIYQTPGHDPSSGKTSLMVFTGGEAPFSATRGPRFDEIADGASSTIMLVMAPPEKAVLWTKPDDIATEGADPLRSLGQIPEDGLLVSYFDGQTEAIPSNVSPAALKALISHRSNDQPSGTASVLDLDRLR